MEGGGGNDESTTRQPLSYKKNRWVEGSQNYFPEFVNVLLVFLLGCENLLFSPRPQGLSLWLRSHVVQVYSQRANLLLCR